MKQIILIFLGLYAFSCNNTNTKTEVEMGSNKEIVDLEMCLCDSLTESSDHSFELNGVLFTGNCISNYPMSDQKYIEKQILNGKIHGKISYFDKSGHVLVEEMYNNGNLIGNIGDNTNQCACAALKIKDIDNSSKAFLNNILFSGHCEDYFPNSKQISLEANYNKGLLDGFTIVYKKNGQSLMIQEYDNGQLLNEIYPKD